MDQVKIGRFIQEKRKEKKLTQSEVAEKLNITDRAISKWENGVCLPDAGTMPELCEILGISINDLFSGEKVDMKENEKKLEENLLEMTKIKEQKDKMLLRLEIVLEVIVMIFFLALIMVAAYVEMEMYLRIILIIGAFILLIPALYYGIKIEQVAGLYECSNCHHKYVPTFKSVFLAQHMGRTRKMKCPKCDTKCWHKKVLK